MHLDRLDLEILRALRGHDATSTTLAKRLLPENGQSLQAKDAKIRARLMRLQPLVAYTEENGRRLWIADPDRVVVGDLTCQLREKKGRLVEMRLGESIIIKEVDGEVQLRGLSNGSSGHG